MQRAGPHKRVRFDPSLQREQFHARRRMEDEVTTNRKVLRVCIKQGFNLAGAELLDSLSCKDLDLALVALLGLRGVCTLLVSLEAVPSEMLAEDRIHYITNIVNHGVSSEVHFDQSVIQSLIPLVEPLRDGGVSILRKVSQSTGVAHTAFVVPPVSHCLNSQCKNFHCGKQLHRHHQPITGKLTQLAYCTK